MSILTTSDFTGKHLVVLNGNATLLAEFNSVIADVEKRYLRSLLGDDLYIAFIAGLSENTPHDKWVALRDGENYKTYDYNDDNEMYTFQKVFQGIKEMLKYFTRIEWYNYNRFARRNIGIVKTEVENGTMASQDQFQDSQILLLNEAIEIYNEAIEYVYEMNFEAHIISWSGSTATVVTTKHLVNGDTIKLDGVDRVVSNVTTTTFDVAVTSGSNWQKYFYPNLSFKAIEKQVIGIGSL